MKLVIDAVHRCWASSRERIAEWRRRALCRRLTRIDAEIEASRPFSRN